jgi:AcrR family transcriptional regulator
MPTATRPYLRADARRDQLLEAAARLFERGGYAGLTMVALAGEAGVSRRLVYDHFPDVASLYNAFFTDRAARHLGAIDGALAEAGPDRVAGFTAAFARLLAVPPDDRRAIRLVLTDADLPELAPVRARFRAHVEKRWLHALGRGGDRRTDRARLWMVVNALFALADLVDRREISGAAATRLATEFVQAAAG